MTRLVLAGSRAADVSPVARAVGEILRVVPEPTVLLRRGALTITNPFEATVYAACFKLDIPTQFWVPDLAKHEGRRSAWFRDCDMLESADLCVCFYAEHEIGDDTSGTVALVDKAIGLEVPVYAYAVKHTAAARDWWKVERVGEYDEEDRWGSTLTTVLP